MRRSIVSLLATVAVQVGLTSAESVQHLARERDDNIATTDGNLVEPIAIPCPMYDVVDCLDGQPHLWRKDDNGCDVPYCPDVKPEPEPLPEPLPEPQLLSPPEIQCDTIACQDYEYNAKEGQFDDNGCPIVECMPREIATQVICDIIECNDDEYNAKEGQVDKNGCPIVECVKDCSSIVFIQAPCEPGCIYDNVGDDCGCICPIDPEVITVELPCPMYALVACPEGQHYLWEKTDDGCDVPTKCVDIEPEPQPEPCPLVRLQECPDGMPHIVTKGENGCDIYTCPDPIGCPPVAYPLCSPTSTIKEECDDKGCCTYSCETPLCPLAPLRECPDGKPHIVTKGENGCDVYTCPDPVKPDCGPEVAIKCSLGFIVEEKCDDNGCCKKTCVKDPNYAEPCMLYATAPTCPDGSTPPMKTIDGCHIYDFDSCPEAYRACTQDVLICASNGVAMPRDAKHNCEFPQCPRVTDACNDATCDRGRKISASCKSYSLDGSCSECDVECAAVAIEKKKRGRDGRKRNDEIAAAVKELRGARKYLRKGRKGGK